MPRGKYVNHKGRSRNFASAEELEEKHKKKELKKANRDPNAESEDETDSDSSEEETAKKTGAGDDDDDSSSEEESSSEDENRKKKGVSGLIEIENPNHRRKTTTKVTKVDLSAAAGTSSKPELSRREREELDKQRAAANYAKMHAEGKTEQARADLARLAIIRQNRAEAVARREAEKKEKDDKAKKTAAK